MKTFRFKKWRPSASLIVLGKTVFSKSEAYNYKLLCLRRSAKSSFMPNSYVFPGGNVSSGDSNASWLKVFENHGYCYEKLKILEHTQNKSSIYDEDSQIPKYISLRICAIRETFEECGILICRNNSLTSSKFLSKDWAEYLGGVEIEKWKSRVAKDASEFLNMCLALNVCPDIFALKTWSNWITPLVYEKRFNTAFFLAAFSHLPPACADEMEVETLKWAMPDEYIQLNNNKKITLPPPQFYEICRLRNFNDVELLLEYAQDRSSYGCEEYFPIRIKTKEGSYTILPGDDLYEKLCDMTSEPTSFMKTLPPSHVKNRIFHSKDGDEIIVENLKPKVKHVVPLSKM